MSVSYILSTATAVPAHELSPRTALDHLSRIWPQLGRLDEEATGIGTRYVCEPVEELLRPRGPAVQSASYLAHAPRLAVAAGRRALETAGLSGADVDLVITVSCTGYLVPSLEVHVAPELGLRPSVTRLPITELGCSGGAAAIGFAHRHLVAFPDDNVLVIAVEVPSLSFHPDDRSADNLTACLVFGDGAGAAVLSGRRPPTPCLAVAQTASHLIPGTAHLLGFELGDDGFRVVLDRRLPRALEHELRALVEGFVGECGIERLDFIAAHAAGPRIFEAIRSSLSPRPGALDLSLEVFRRVGNTSSAAIFFTLDRLAQRLGPSPGRGLGLGLGPGVSVELMRLAWTGSEDAGDEPLAAGERPAIGRRGVEQPLLGANAIEQHGGVHG